MGIVVKDALREVNFGRARAYRVACVRCGCAWIAVFSKKAKVGISDCPRCWQRNVVVRSDFAFLDGTAPAAMEGE